MPSKSRSQQKLFQAAEHGATFAKAAHLRETLTHQQLHDFAAGSEQGKPQRVLHPALKHRAAMVQQSHAHLSATVPGFTKLAAKERMKAVQNHVRATMKRGKP